MTVYTVPEYDRLTVKAAGKVLAKPTKELNDEIVHSVDIAINWRASHAYPMLAFYLTLQRRAKKISSQAEPVQRLKRFPSIIRKLRDPNHNIFLHQMQDIGGCRVILPALEHVHALEMKYRNSKWAHKLDSCKDYIESPKESGYRSLHLIYKYCAYRNGFPSPYNGLKIEIQLRTKLQHMWATAVEAADIFTGQALKWSGGRDEWKRFFVLMSSIFAIREKTALVPNTPNSLDEIVGELKQLNHDYHIARAFMGYRYIAPHIINTKGKADFYLLKLDPVNLTVTINKFSKKNFKAANKAYADAEQALEPESGNQVVLVSAKSVSALKRAYPNYFQDTAGFLREVEALVNG